MLDLKTNCERCATALPEDSLDARICAFGCTFCARCSEDTCAGVCPNCAGELLPRPRKKVAPTQSTYLRIVCLSQETAETLALLGLESRVVGVSKFVARPKDGFPDAARIGGFSTTDVSAIEALAPDLVLGYSDVQADMAKSLVAAGLEVHIFNHTTLAGMLQMVRRLGDIVGAGRRAEALAVELEAKLDRAREETATATRPKVYFEEWDEPMICGIGWVSELIELAGGTDVFAELAQRPHAKQRVLQPADVALAAPDVILTSWCGKPLNRERLCARPGFATLPAIVNQRLFDVEGAAILSPGPGLVTEGLPLLRQLLAQGA